MLIKSELDIADILKFIIQFGEEIERFDPSLCGDLLTIENDGKVLCKPVSGWMNYNGFGMKNACVGNIYHWKLKVFECDTAGPILYIGILGAKYAADQLGSSWFYHSNAYSYISSYGGIFHNGPKMRYQAEWYGDGDIIEIWLDLKSDEKSICFAKNGKKSDKITDDLSRSDEYKLAISMGEQRKKVEILLFEIVE